MSSNSCAATACWNRQLESLAGLVTGTTTLQALGKVILDRGWLTPFQVNRVLGGKVQELFLGQYLLQAKLGEGGMGQVFRALDRTMHRTVALKLIRPDVLSSEAAVEQFLKEIRARCRTRSSQHRPRPSRRQARNGLLPRHGVRRGDRPASAHQGRPPAAHRFGLRLGASDGPGLAAPGGARHGPRDVKPMNLLLSTQGVVKLLDWDWPVRGNSPIRPRRHGKGR